MLQTAIASSEVNAAVLAGRVDINVTFHAAKKTSAPMHKFGNDHYKSHHIVFILCATSSHRKTTSFLSLPCWTFRICVSYPCS